MELLGSCSTAELSMRARLPATVPTVISGDGVRSARVLVSSTVMSTSVLRANQTGRGALVCHKIIQHADGTLTLGEVPAMAAKYDKL